VPLRTKAPLARYRRKDVSIRARSENMASEPKANVTNLGTGKPAGRAAKTVESVVKDDLAASAEAELEQFADQTLPERKYSLNALIAAGLIGFVLGRLFSR
jgi:hypothetical protein